MAGLPDIKQGTLLVSTSKANWLNKDTCHFRIWLGYLDSNQGMLASKASALPLGDSPTNHGAVGET